jgi:hypothetical protein
MTTTKITHSDVIEVLGNGGFLPIDDAEQVIADGMANAYAAYAADGFEAVAYDDGAEEPGLLFVKWSLDGIELLATDLRGIPTGQAMFPFTVRGLKWLAGAISEGASHGSP